MIVGKSGSGKSVLGNKLLNTNSDPDHFEWYFKEGGGSAGVTTDCLSETSKNGKIRVIDTPGIPDPSKKNTLKYFNAIVEKIRSLRAMNLLIFMVKEDRTNMIQFDQYCTLLKQFNNLSCEKLMICRQRDYPYPPTEKAKEKKRKEGFAFVDDILSRSGMDMPFMLVMDGSSQEANEALNKLHAYVQTCHRSSLTDSSSSLKTYDEWKLFCENLASRMGRMTALKEQLKMFARSVKYHQRWKMVHTCVGVVAEVASIETLGVSGAAAAVAGGIIYITNRQIATIQQKEKMAQEEIEKNHVNEDSLREAKEEFNALKRLEDE